MSRVTYDSDKGSYQAHVIVKSVLIFLSIIGYCNLWLAVVLDFATAIATVLNTIRITGPSLRANLRYKFGK